MTSVCASLEGERLGGATDPKLRDEISHFDEGARNLDLLFRPVAKRTASCDDVIAEDVLELPHIVLETHGVKCLPNVVHGLEGPVWVIVEPLLKALDGEEADGDLRRRDT